jgi:predicted deacylase
MSKPGTVKRFLTGEWEDHKVRIPFIELTGAEDGPTLAVIAGVHGSEYPGIEAALRLAGDIELDKLRGRLRIVPIMNMPAFLRRAEAVCPVDGKNPNRVFPGDPDGSYTDIMAHLVFEHAVKGSDAVLNVHGGDIFEALVPYAGVGRSTESKVDQSCRELGLAYDMPFLVRFAVPHDPATGLDLNSAVQASGIPSILVEAGGNGLLDEEDVRVHLKGFRNIMIHLDMIDGTPVHEHKTRECISDFWRLEHTGVVYPSAKLGQRVSEGDDIGIVRDFFGDEITRVHAPRDAWIIAIVTTPAAVEHAIVYQVAYEQE